MPALAVLWAGQLGGKGSVMQQTRPEGHVVTRRFAEPLTEDTLLMRISALIDGRDYTELELTSTAWGRWAYYAARGEWQ